MSPQDELGARPRWYLPLVVGTVLVLAALIAAAFLVESDAVDSVLGFFTGFLTMVLGGVLLSTEMGRRATILRRETALLDDLEPLRAASAIDYSSRGSVADHTIRPTITKNADQSGTTEDGR